MTKSLLITIVMIAVGAMGTVWVLGRFSRTDTKESVSESSILPRLPLEATLGVLGTSDVIEADPHDPILSMVSGTKSSVTAVPASLEADGTTSTTVVVTLRTDDGTLVSGAQVNLESNRGVQDRIEVVRGITGSDGQAIFLVRSPEPGTMILTARAGTKLIDQKATVKLVDPVSAASFNATLVWAGLGAILLLVFFQYLFARVVLAARSREEEELFFHHPGVLSRR